MTNNGLVNVKLIDVFRLLSYDANLQFHANKAVRITASGTMPLMQINPTNIILPVYPPHTQSPLTDSFIDMELLKKFIKLMSEKKSFLRLNHIGFCYRVKSKIEERKRIQQEVQKTEWNLYEMESVDESLWLFIGDNKIWTDPLIEYLPVEKTDDPDVDIWLPHIHIDVDTNMTMIAVEDAANSAFDGKVTPFRLNPVGYSVRLRLGLVSGMNIMIDLATNKRDTEYGRKHMLTKINT